MTRKSRPLVRTAAVAALSAILSLALLGGCGDDKDSNDGPGSAPQDEGG